MMATACERGKTEAGMRAEGAEAGQPTEKRFGHPGHVVAQGQDGKDENQQPPEAAKASLAPGGAIAGEEKRGRAHEK